jgi:hypothetical protein
MTYDEFRSGMNELEVVYFSERNEQRLEVLRGAWYKTFAQSDVRDFTKAIECYKNGEDGQKPPRPAAILWLAKEAKAGRSFADRATMIAKFGPLEHECCAKVEQARAAILAYKQAQSLVGEYRRPVKQLSAVSEPRALLAFAEPSGYEAIHVECQAEKCRCPFCGHESARQVNPFVVWLKHRYPKQTANWVTWFKGTLVCDGCKLLLKNGARIALESKPCPIVGQSPKEVRDFKSEAEGNHES